MRKCSPSRSRFCKIKTAAVIFLALIATAPAITPRRAAVLSAGTKVIGSCSIPTNWGSATINDSGTGGTATSVSETLTVPAGNAGTLKFAYNTPSGTTLTWNYSTNGSTFTTVANNGTVTFTNGQTVYLQLVEGTSCGAIGGISTMTVTDNTTGAAVGTYAVTISVLC